MTRKISSDVERPQGASDAPEWCFQCVHGQYCPDHPAVDVEEVGGRRLQAARVEETLAWIEAELVELEPRTMQMLARVRLLKVTADQLRELLPYCERVPDAPEGTS